MEIDTCTLIPIYKIRFKYWKIFSLVTKQKFNSIHPFKKKLQGKYFSGVDIRMQYKMGFFC